MMSISVHRRGQVSCFAGRDIKRSLCEEGKKNPRWAVGLVSDGYTYAVQLREEIVETKDRTYLSLFV